MVDRLAELKKNSKRESVREDNDEQKSDEDNGSDEDGMELKRRGSQDGDTEMNSAELDDFFKDVEKMKGWMKEIKHNVDIIKKQYTSLLSVTESDSGKEIRDELARLRDETNSIGQKMRNELKKMRTDNDAFLRDHSNDPSLCKIRTNMHGSLVRTFYDLMQEYQQILSKYDAKMREKAYRQVKLVAPDANEDQINEVLDQGGDVTEQIFAKHIMEDRKHQNAQQALDYLQERHNDILDLEKAIGELHQLFLDMAILVESQGDLIDQIQFSVSQTKSYHEKAERTLAIAEKQKSKIRKKKVIICIIITATILIILIVIAIIIAIVVALLTKK